MRFNYEEVMHDLSGFSTFVYILHLNFMLQQNIKVAVDAIVFGYAHQELHVLLIKQKYGVMKNQWALVGGS